jgi:hypothetical protein
MAVRSHWSNLNGRWEFRFDPNDRGLAEGWEKPGTAGYDRSITVPFPWESKLAGVGPVEGQPKIGWYRRTFNVPAQFPASDRLWLRFGAVDWRADVWVNGKAVATHEGGYTPFGVDITDALAAGSPNVVVVRAFDPTDPSLPTGKQVGWYTPTSGIWQTVWLESRPAAHIAGFTMVPSIDPARVAFRVEVAGVPEGSALRVEAASQEPGGAAFQAGAPLAAAVGGRPVASFNLDVPNPRLWSPESPNLYDVSIALKDAQGRVIDTVQSYFGLRTIARGRYGNEPFERILLNGKPLYLRTALDQSFNPDGIYTAPDDEFLKRDLAIARANGLNGLRIHIKPDEPRRLYWADHYGLLILEDMPNTWRQNPTAREAWQKTMTEAVARDRNHPAIIAWVAFNETWGLGRPEDYKKDVDTQKWVGEMVSAIRALDPSRLVEDNSPCNYDHVAGSDLNSWHFYIDDHDEARRHIQEVVDRSTPGSGFNYCPGYKQTDIPLINSEYGSVSAGGGDRDVSWGFRDLTTQLRRHSKIQGYVYTELSDIEWEHNGFVDYNRGNKVFGYDAWLPAMSPADLNGADFVGYDAPPAIVGKPGETVTVPVFVSHYSDRRGPVSLQWSAFGLNDRGERVTIAEPVRVSVAWTEYGVKNLEPISIRLPDQPIVGALALTLQDEANQRFAANFVNLVVRPDSPLPRVQRSGEQVATLRFSPGEFASQQWADAAKPPAGKAYGHGKGSFEYRIKVPESVVRAQPARLSYRFEAGAKAAREQVDWAERTNPQDYPQTDARVWPSTLEISINGRKAGRVALADDAADARGVLSHLARVEHGSHGERVEGQVELNDQDREALLAGKPLILRLAVPEDAPHAGGLCLFGAETGELPLDPTLEIFTANPLPADLGVNPKASITAQD